MKKKAILLIIFLAAITVLGFGGFYIWQYNQAYHEVNVEAGISLSPQDFLVKPDETAVFSENGDTLNNRVPGDYNIIVKTSKFEHKVLVHIKDTIAPVAEPKSIRIDIGETASANEFVQNISDATEVKVSFSQEPDFSKDGKQDVSIILEDLGGNIARYISELTVSHTKSELEVEAGSSAPTLADFLLGECNAELKTDLSSIDYSTVGDNEVVIEINGTPYVSNLKVVDTVAPTLEVCNVQGFAKAKISIDRFVVWVDDISPVTYSYETEPDFSTAGTKEVTIVAKDISGNTTSKTATLTLAEDNEAPVLSGLKNFISYSGHAIAFKDKVKVSDNNPENLSLDIDTGDLNISVPGDYTVVYTATDASGNSTSQSIVVSIRGKEYTDEFVNELADAANAKCIKAGMSTTEKCYAIFKYVRKNLTFYTGHSTKLFWQQGAVDAFVDGTGDCYMYACMAKAMLTRAGVENIDIKRSEGARPTSHYWNLVYIDDSEVPGWYHFDCLTMRDGTQFFLWTDAMIKEYDETHPGYHTYDADLYPVIN